MNFRHRLIAAICSAAISSFTFSSIASAQIESEGMDDISVWGERYLSSTEAEFSSNLWAGADHQHLLSLMHDIDVDQLSLAGRTLVRRLILSSAQNVTGPYAGEILARRAELMLELNEIDAAMALLPNLDEPGAVIEPDILATDLELAAGNIATACDRLSQPVSEHVYWTKLRAACAAMAGNYSGAQLTVEMAPAELFNDTWFIEAIYALEDGSLLPDADSLATDAIDPDPADDNSAMADADDTAPLLRPAASFANGLGIALSLSEGLDTSALDPDTIAPHLIAILVKRPDLPIQLRQLLAGTDSASALTSGPEIRALIEVGLVAPDDYILGPEQATILQLQAPETGFLEKADVLIRHLDQASSGSLKDFRRVSQLYATELNKLPKENSMVSYADLFARTAYANGDIENAHAWLDIAYPAPVPPKPVPVLPEPKPVALTGNAGDTGADAPGPGPVALDAAAGAPLSLSQAGMDGDGAVQGTEDSVADGAAHPAGEDRHEPAHSPDHTTAHLDGVGDSGGDDDALSQAGMPAAMITTKSPLASANTAVAPRPEPYIGLVFDLFASLSDPNENQAEIIPHLIEAAQIAGETEQLVQLLYHLPAFGVSLDAGARALLLAHPVAGRRLDPNIAATVQAASTEPAIAEAALMLLTLIEDEPHTLSAWDQGLLLSALVEIGARDIAVLLIQDFSQYWQPDQRPARATPTDGMWDALTADEPAEQPFSEGGPDFTRIS